MKITTGLELLGNVVAVSGNCVRFHAPDGQVMFEVTAGKDGASIEVRAPNTCKVDGVLHDNRIMVMPNVSNSITIRTPIYGE